MKKDIIIAGVGGQGIISIAAMIGYAALEKNLNIKQTEVHGMSQRGGEVVTHLRLSDTQIYSDLVPIGKADLIIGMEPLEALRYIHFLKPDGWLISNSIPIMNMISYPDINKIISRIKEVKNHILIPANDIAKQHLNNDKVVNTLLLGACAPFLGLTDKELLNAIEKFFSNKGEQIIELNKKAFQLGFNFSENYK